MKKHEFCRWCKNFYTETIEIDEENYRIIDYCKLDNKEVVNSCDCCEKYQFDKIKFKKDKSSIIFVTIMDFVEDNIEK